MILSSNLSWFKKISRKFIELVKTQKTFKPPKKAKILVFDGVVNHLLEPLFKGEPYEVLFIRGEKLNLSPIILYKFLLFLIRERERKYAYFLAYIDQVSPAIIITYIDNNSLFQRADSKNKDKGKKFIAIANGTRNLSGGSEQLKTSGLIVRKIFHSNLFCHGKFCADEYEKHLVNVENIFPVGSLQDSYFRDLPKKIKKPTFDICLVVTPFYNIPYESTLHLNGRQSCELSLSYLRVFKEIHDVKISAISKYPADIEESECELKWLQRFLGNGFTYFPNKDNVPSSSYIISNDAEVVIGQASTLLRECFGRGKKVLQVNYSDEPLHDFPFEGIWLLKKSGYPDFEKRLLDLLSMDQDHYKKQCKHFPGYLIGYDESKPTHIVISEFIQQHIQQHTGVV